MDVLKINSGEKFIYLQGLDQKDSTLINLSIEEFESYITKNFDEFVAFNTFRSIKYDIN